MLVIGPAGAGKSVITTQLAHFATGYVVKIPLAQLAVPLNGEEGAVQLESVAVESRSPLSRSTPRKPLIADAPVMEGLVEDADEPLMRCPGPNSEVDLLQVWVAHRFGENSDIKLLNYDAAGANFEIP